VDETVCSPDAEGITAGDVNAALVPRLPRIDLHRHLEVRVQTILELGRAHGIALPASTPEGLRPMVEIAPDAYGRGLLPFLTHLHWMTAVLADLDAVRRVARENVEDAARDGLDYVELRFSPYFFAAPFGLDPVAVTEAVIAGVDEGRAATGLPVNLIGILSRTFGPEQCTVELDALLTQRDRIVALDLAGDEAGWPAARFARHFARARDAGWAITVHAGEAAPAASVWEAIRLLGAQRIGHGTRVIDDPALMAFIAERRIGIECNLSSNVHTGAARSYAEHPLKAFLAHGILASINTDNPKISGIDWPHEIAVAAPAAGLGAAEIAQAQENALAIAFLTPNQRAALADSLERGA
jgi:adenosine deaminase